MPAAALGARVEKLGPGLPGAPISPGSTAVFAGTGADRLGLLTSWGHRHGARIFFDLDSWLVLRSDRNLAMWALAIWARESVHRCHERSLWREAVRRARNATDWMERDLTRADGLIVASQTIAETYSAINANVHVCRNAVNPEDWPAPPRRSGPFRIGVAGAGDHLADLDVVRPALEWLPGSPAGSTRSIRAMRVTSPTTPRRGGAAGACQRPRNWIQRWPGWGGHEFLPGSERLPRRPELRAFPVGVRRSTWYCQDVARLPLPFRW